MINRLNTLKNYLNSIIKRLNILKYFFSLRLSTSSGHRAMFCLLPIKNPQHFTVGDSIPEPVFGRLYPEFIRER